MALQQIKFAPGIDKQDTSVGAVGRWIDSDNVRFRYGLPEKVGGWQSLLPDTIVGVARKQHAIVDTSGNRYVILGTDKFLICYFEGGLHDITPFDTDSNGAVIALASTAVTNTANTSITITTGSTLHGFKEGDIVFFSAFAVPSGSSLSNASFLDKPYQVITVPSNTTFTITSPTQEAGGGTLTDGTCTVNPYARVGPAAQTYGYGFGVGQYGGTVQGSASSTLNGTIAAADTTISLADSRNFTASGTALIGDFSAGSYATTSELVTYTGNSDAAPGNLTTVSRSQLGTTAPTNTTTGTTVTQATDWTGWGDPVVASTVTLEPGLWSLSSFGEVLVASIFNGKTFTWNSGDAARLTKRASQLTTNFPTTNNPDKTRLTLVSPTTRHLIHFGTEDTIGTPTTQEDLLIRFSEQENINEYTIQAVNTAGSQRLQDGTKIMGAISAKENILVWTDNALYTMKFVGAPFTFGFEQVGTNCGLIGQNAAIEIDGVAYWMSNNGFFSFDGTVNTLPCSVEDYVFDDADTTKGQQINAGINNLFTEVTWWYPSQGSEFNDRYVVYNYGQTNEPVRMGNWYTGINSNSIRTTWMDTSVYPKPYATSFDSSKTGSFPVIGGETGLGQTVFFEQETGTDQINPNGTTTTLTSFVESFDFALQTDQGIGEYFLSMSRFLPNFKNLLGNAVINVSVTPYPAQLNSASSFSPFTIDSATTFVSTRARGRYAAIKIENTGAGQSWRFGTFQADLKPDGRR
ncbi:hypothetical protein OAN66_01535 [bacterium]|nr:hypothetical protein [bacterium]